MEHIINVKKVTIIETKRLLKVHRHKIHLDDHLAKFLNSRKTVRSQRRPTDFTRALVRIDSVNPDLVPGAIGWTR